MVEKSILSGDMEKQIRYDIKSNIALHLFDYGENSKLNDLLKHQFDTMIDKFYSARTKSSAELKLFILRHIVFYNTNEEDSDSLIDKIIKHKTPDKIAKSFIGKEPFVTYNTLRASFIDSIKPPETVDIPPDPPIPSVLKSDFMPDKYDSLFRGFFYKSTGAYIAPVFNAIATILQNVESNPTDINHVYYTATLEFCNRMLYLFQNNSKYIQWKIRRLLFSSVFVKSEYFESLQKNAKTICHLTFNSERPLARIMSLFVWAKLYFNTGNDITFEKTEWADTLKSIASGTRYESDPSLNKMIDANRSAIYGRSDASDSQILTNLGLVPIPE